ncbi:hypothetical protein Q4603_20385 [Zobellia galactanivorans]|uniref:hypothetical protein n=1 Tax=Zobellia galactanivorans (strain DSM 12802 / CCUG 47099 / CIP 106680 / NCIMB 13871 / Dsij) TaxID=63186 RepID=UPI0026E350A1|nr:hypothetical protein [Zobellia galactanivorans]MDO6810990.1 hypothetical protein [Zobellia galactanivorans]
MKFLRRGIISLVFIILAFSSCNERKSAVGYKKKSVATKILNERFQVVGDDKNLVYHLPDTIGLNDTLKGYVVYKSDFDTIKSKPNKRYFVNFYLAKTDSLSKDFKDFQTKKIDTFARIHDSLFLIYDITFKKRGSHLLEGYIKDYLYYDEGKDSVRFKSLESHVMYKVYVE